MRIITREDVRRLKLQKKKKTKRLYALFIIMLIAAVAAAIIIYASNAGKKDKDGADNNRKNEDTADTATPLIPEQTTEATTELIGEGTTEIASITDPSRNYYDQYIANAGPNDFSYDVPESQLSDIHTINGNNWADSSAFIKNPSEPISLNYFNDAVFVGDSRTEGLMLYSNLGNLNGICYKGLNVGILDEEKCILMPGEKKKVTCFEAISGSKYNYYYCMFGVNELGWVDVDTFIKCFGDLIDHIHSVNQNAIIYVENIMPVTRELSAKDEVFNIERIQSYNEKLLAMCKKRKDVIYLDLYSAVADEEGYLPDDTSPDGVHLDVTSCMRVMEYIRMNTYSRK